MCTQKWTLKAQSVISFGRSKGSRDLGCKTHQVTNFQNFSQVGLTFAHECRFFGDTHLLIDKKRGGNNCVLCNGICLTAS